MRAANPDLTIDSVLRDPMIRAVMAADRIAAGDFERLLRTAAKSLDALPPVPVAAATMAAAPRPTQGRGLLPRLCFA